MKYLLIAEKPSLMRDIRDCYMKHKDEVIRKVGEIEFIAISGHMCRQAEPNEYSQWGNTPWEQLTYPMIPKTWEIREIKDARKKELLVTIRKKAKECDGLICATDSDVEGYGIFYLISTYLGLRNKPALRFIEHSLTDEEILESLLSMTDIYTDPVHQNFTNSWLIRSRADWLYGFNLSRMITVSSGSRKTIGRVKAPTIKLVFDRCNEIDQFKKKVYYALDADYGTFKARMIDESGKPVYFENKRDVPLDIPFAGKVLGVQQKENVIHCQKLYDLSSLQAEAGRVYGYSPQETLDTAEELYLKHKVLSYPRTQCRYVSTERAKEFSQMLKAAFAFQELADVVNKAAGENKFSLGKAQNKRVVNDAEVKKEAHDALLPTGTIIDLGVLSEAERNIYYLVCKRLVEQFLPDNVVLKTAAIIGHPDKKGAWFKAEGAVTVERGFQVLSPDKNMVELPPLEKGDAVEAKSISPAECSTKPPARFTQTSLAVAMEGIAKLVKDKEAAKSLAESKGIGQPSTRAKIISEIIHYGYVEEKQKKLYITDAGRAYMESLKGIGIEDPIFAAMMDMQIKRVQRGEESMEAAYSSVLSKLEELCGKIKLPERTSQQVDVVCPRCGKPFATGTWKYTCGCKGKGISRVPCGHTITSEELRDLCAGKKIGPFVMVSKKGNRFGAYLSLAPGEEQELVFEYLNA